MWSAAASRAPRHSPPATLLAPRGENFGLDRHRPGRNDASISHAEFFAGSRAVDEGIHLSDEVRASPLWNEDLSPTRPEQRTWTKWNVAALWVGMSVCIPTYMLAAGMIQGGMNWWQATLTIFLGNAIVLVPMVLNAHAGTRYGIPFPVLARSAFGVHGSNVPCLMRALVACGWFGIQTWIGGSAVYGLHAILTPGLVAWLDGLGAFSGITAGQYVFFLIFWLINMVFVWIGTESIRWLEVLAAPFLIGVGFLLMFWAWSKAGGAGPIFSEPDKFATRGAFFAMFFPSLTAMVGYWATLSLNISDFSRYAKSQKDQILGQTLGLPPTMTFYSFIGIFVTSATLVIFGEAIWDPVKLLQKFDSPVIVIVSLFSLTVATISTNIAANIVSPANDFSNLSPKRISFKTGGTIAGVIGILIMPWKLLTDLGGYIFTWLIGYSALLGPVAAILIADYFLIRRRNLNVADLFRTDGEYRKWNVPAFVALAVGIAPNVPGFLHAATNGRIGVPELFQSVYPFAWFVGFAIAFLVYVAIGRGRQER